VFPISARRITDKVLEASTGGMPELMPDGKRFILTSNGTEEVPTDTHVTFLLNFSDELKRRLTPRSKNGVRLLGKIGTYPNSHGKLGYVPIFFNVLVDASMFTSRA
jgi:hypothetical protein